MSERMAFRLAGLSRSAYRRPLKGDTVADPDRALRDWLRAWAKKHPRYGYRRAYHDARGEGWAVNHKKIQRLWRAEGLRVPQRRRCKRVGSSTVDAPAAVAPNLVWAVDFQFDADERGCPIKICSVVDEHTGECIGGLVERSITVDRLTAHLEELVAVRGAPGCAPQRQRARVHQRRDGRLGGYPHRPVLHSAWLALAQRIRRIVQQPPLRRVPQHQQLLLTAARPGRDRRLEDRVQPSASALIARLPTPGRVRPAVHPSNRNRRLTERPDRMKGAAHDQIPALELHPRSIAAAPRAGDHNRSRLHT